MVREEFRLPFEGLEEIASGYVMPPVPLSTADSRR
jgi:hypothetical protein